MDIFGWIIMCEFVISLILQSITAYLFTKILFRRNRGGQLATVERSPSLYFYFAAQIMTAVTTVIFAAYYFLFWLQITIIFNAYLWFFIFTIQKLTFISLPLAAFALGFDRCMCVLWPIKYKKSILPVLIASVIIVGVLLYSLIFILIPMFPDCRLHECKSHPMTGGYSHVRYFTSALILVTCICLLVFFRQKTATHFGKNITGRVQ